jgi:oxaloacetate decarboxylase alpha subunit
MTKKIKLIDVTLRDAHQSLWATRMTTAMMKEVVPLLDRAGFEAIDLVGGAVFDVAVRYLREDPWERMRILSSWVEKTPLIVHTRGQSLFTFEFFSDDIVELTAERIFANGIRYHTLYDPLNDIRNLEIPIRAARRVGLHTVPGLVYTVSPVHTDAYYERKAKELLALGGIDGLFIKDPSGLLTPERVATLGPDIEEDLRRYTVAVAYPLLLWAWSLRCAAGGRTRRRCSPHRHLDLGQRYFARSDRVVYAQLSAAWPRGSY